jgi:outer membrane protein
MRLMRMVLVTITVSLMVGGGWMAMVFAAEPLATRVIPDILTLEKAVELAVSNHPSLRVSSGTQAINEALVGQAQSGLYPQVQGLSGYQLGTANPTRNFTGAPIARNTSGSTFPYYQNSVTLNQLLYDFGTTKSQVDTAQYNLKAANSDAETTLQTVVVNVQQAYYGLQQAQRLVTVNEEALLQFQKHLDLAKGRFKAGVAPKIDVTTAEVDLSNAQLNLITAKNNLAVARVTMNNAMGVLTADPYRVQEPEVLEPYQVALDEAVASAMQLRPEMISQRAQERSAETAIKAAQGGYLPTVTSSAAYSYSGTESPLVYNWNVSGTVNIPIFSGYLTQQQVAQARANFLKTKANGEVLKQNILLEVNQALLNLQAARERLQLTAVTIKQAKERLAQVEGRYKAGLSNAIEVTDAEVALVNAQVNDVVALSNYQAAKAQLERAMGISTPVRGS